MSEPTGYTADGTPWEEPRPPHLPDRLSSISPWVWPFVILAAVQVALIWMDNWTFIEAVPGFVGQVMLFGAIAVSPSLLGAALFLRHPHAHRTLPLVVVGVVLLAIAQFLRLLQWELWPSVETGLPSAGDVDALLSSHLVQSTIYGLIVIGVGVIGVAILAHGLHRARQNDGDVSRLVFLALSVIALALTAYRVVAYRQVPDDQPGLADPIFVGVDGAITFVAFLAWSYLVAVALAGWRAGERPSVGWALATISGALSLLVSGVVATLDHLSAGDVGAIFSVLILATAAGPLALLAAFAVGLPSTAPELGPIDWE